MSSGSEQPRGRSGRAVAALVAGAAVGATAAGGTALLLYTGQGFIRAAGLLVSSTIMAIAAGVWAGAPAGGVARRSRLSRATRLRWLALTIAMLAGGMFAAVWAGSAAVRELSAGGAVAVLLVLAMPAYATGSLLAALQAGLPRARRHAGGGVAAGALAGSAIGILVATAMLIQTLQPSGIYYGAAALVAVAALFDRGAGASAAPTGDTDMTDHVTLITGVGARGQLGYTVARTFLESGATVTITDRNPDIEPIAAELAAYGNIVGHRADLLQDDDVAGLIAGVRDRHGRLDSLINIAGGLTVLGTVEHTTAEQWRAEIGRNAETALRTCRAALPLLRASRGAIVNFTSPAAAHAPAGLAAYSAAKAAVVAITQALAVEEKDAGVRVNAIAPGPMDTQQNRHGVDAEEAERHTFVSRDEVADVVLFLAGPAARGVSGQTLQVPGQTLA